MRKPALQNEPMNYEKAETPKIGEQLRLARERAELTQEALAAMFDVNRISVSNWEGDKNYPDVPKLIGLAKALRISLDDVFSLREPPSHYATLSADEQALVVQYRQSSDTGKQTIANVAKAMANAQDASTPARNTLTTGYPAATPNTHTKQAS